MRRDICIQVFQDIPLGQRDVWKKQVFQSPVPHPCLLRTSRIPCTHRALHRHRAFPGIWSLLPFLTAIIPWVSSISILTFSSITEFSLMFFLAWPYKNVFDDIWYTTVLFSFWHYSLPGKSLLLQKVTIRKISPQKLFSWRSEWMEIQEYKNKLPLSPFIYVEACLLSNGNIYSPPSSHRTWLEYLLENKEETAPRLYRTKDVTAVCDQGCVRTEEKWFPVSSAWEKQL